jgi:hypothetical protein
LGYSIYVICPEPGARTAESAEGQLQVDVRQWFDSMQEYNFSLCYLVQTGCGVHLAFNKIRNVWTEKLTSHFYVMLKSKCIKLYLYAPYMPQWSGN